MMLLLHVLMLSLLSGGSARVVPDFELECGQFFAGGKSPTKLPGPQYEQICQKLDDFYYATYYDTSNKIPVYSAFVFKGIMGCKRKTTWYIEPQLDYEKGSTMASEGTVVEKLRGNRQALNKDYKDSGYHRGHLAPVYQATSQSCADATFTLTNAAPQNPSFNRGQWKTLEKNITEELSKQCLPKRYFVYIVTGVVPGTKKMKTVKVPSHFWTAYCCLSNNKCQESRGFIGVNENITPQNITVNQLETELTKLYKVKSFEVFDRSTVKVFK